MSASAALISISVHLCNRYGFPIPIPITPNNALVKLLTGLNGRITQWGYTDDIQEYVRAFKAEYAAAKVDDEAIEAWMEQRGKWLVEANEIMGDVSRFLSEGWLETLSSEVAGLLWQHISGAVWKMQYMSAFLQVYLDHMV
ncbi:hypothetical protein C8Q73DRAFT_652606 [Cubamyces lactineus]|nr:hypothetical protein C8Q73DRAFT_669637 [Cubamyces lactineus]KAH9890402.1 hypothetical protein C8Q73DRAFT_652606 [Cubamyces lactineus]